MNPLESLLAYSEKRRAGVFAASGLLVLLIAFVDWRVAPDAALGALYLLPVLLVSGFLNGWQVVALAAVCSLLREVFGPFHWEAESAVRLSVAAAGFALAGFFVSALNRQRLLVMRHLEELTLQTRLREDAEQRTRALVETSPLAILTLDSAGRISLANRAAHELLGFEGQPLQGSEIRPYLPVLAQFLRTRRPAEGLRTAVECRGCRRNGEVFLAHIWLSSYGMSSGPGLAAVIWDASENVRDREGASLDSMMATSRILLGAVSHEVRNLATAAGPAHRGLAGIPGVEQTEHFQALGAIVGALERIADSGLRLASDRSPAVADLGNVLDEARVVIEPLLQEGGIRTLWRTANGLPLVQADHHNLLRVFLNLARNSREAMSDSAEKELLVEARAERDLVVVRFRDTGCGVANPEDLFRPFQPGARATGLGLYISRAILRSYGGDLRFEPQPRGSCFAVELWPVEEPREE
jgi:PAS domain S-box-containing protein